jgi:hypothetical protein
LESPASRSRAALRRRLAETNFPISAILRNITCVSTRELIEKEIANLPEDLQRKVYDFAVRLKTRVAEEPFNGSALSDSVLTRDWNSPEEDAAWANL